MQCASTKLLMRLDSFRNFTDAPNVGAALQIASRMANFPLPVTMGAVMESFTPVSSGDHSPPAVLEELSGYLAQESLILRHVLPPGTTIQPLQAVGVCVSPFAVAMSDNSKKRA